MPDPTPPADDSFDPRIDPKHLRKRSIRGAGLTGINQITKLLLRFGSTAILARMLTPADYGLIGMTAVVTGFFSVFLEAGLSQATVQREKISHSQVSNLFWINTALGILLCLIIIALAYPIALFYGDPRLTEITIWLSTSYALGGISVQHSALLRRRMQYTSLVAVDICAAVGGIAVAIAMASRGYGYWALVGMSLGTAGLTFLGLQVATKWRPSLPTRSSGTLSMVRFGADILTFNFVNYFARKADNLLIGWRWGAEPLGLYDKAYSLLLLPIKQISGPFNAVAVPTLSRMKNEPERLSRTFCRMIEVVASLSIPIIGCIAVFADEVVLLWLGPNWIECAEIFRFLAVAAVSGACLNPTGALLIALGQTKRYKRVGLISSMLVVLAFAAGLPYGAQGVAIAYSIAQAVIFVPSWTYTLSQTPVSLGSVLKAFAPAFISTAVAVGCAMALKYRVFPDLAPWQRFGIAAGGYALIYAGTVLLVFQRWRLYRSLIEGAGLFSSKR